MYKNISPTTTRLYSIWQNMKQRCTNPKATEYANYGGRGITVCAEWLHDFKAFEDWAYSHGYREYLTIDRVDNNKGYSPDNCRCVTMEDQARNRRGGGLLYEIDGILKTSAEWAKIAGISRKRFNKRWKDGKRGKDLLAPINEKFSNKGRP